MFGIGTAELVVILVLAFLIIGPKDLPKVARNIGSAMKSLKKTTDDFKGTIEEELSRVEHSGTNSKDSAERRSSSAGKS